MCYDEVLERPHRSAILPQAGFLAGSVEPEVNGGKEIADKMPDFCAAYGCCNRRCLETRTRGITFHLFPKSRERRRKWEVALRRDGFAATDRTLICSEHFKTEDFDRTGQTVRIKDGVVPSIFSFPAHLQRSVAIRSTTTSRQLEDSLPMDLMPDVTGTMSRRQPSPLLFVQPCRGLWDEKLCITVQKLPPGQEVTLHSLLHSEDGDFWEAFGHYVSDATGAVRVAVDASVGGSYTGVEPMGLLWGLSPAAGSRPGLRLRKKDICTPSVIHISAYEGHVIQGFRERKTLASVDAERWYLAPGVQRIEVNEHGLTGTLFLPAGFGPFPAILDLWGGGGGLVEYRSALLASHGYAALALQYLSQKEMPSVGNEYFEAAFTFLQNHPRVCGDRVALFGLSFGTSVSLGLAAYSTVIQPRCLVCVSGSHVQPVRGSLADIFIQFGKNAHKTRYDDQQRVIWRDLLLPIPTDPRQKVDVGRIQCPVLLIVGEDDQNWPASESAEDMERMMEEAGKSHLFTKLSYPGAGHLIEPPYSPHVRASNFITLGTKAVALWGGQAQPHSHAQEDSWQKTLAFLERHLYGVGVTAGL